jgi:polysaccharide chain length determinant protein (PEP-CTERM system associated)
MLPGRTYTPDDIFAIVRRRTWVLVLTTIVGTAVAIEVSRLLPSHYRSEAVIMFEPQRVPDAYVKSIPAEAAVDSLAMLESQILSRSRLEQIITDLNLYPELRASAPMEDVIARMLADIGRRVETKTSFRLSYVSRDPVTAQRVADRLSSFFIEQSVRDREMLATDTSSFLDSQLNDAKRQLIEHERKLEEYRLRHSNELPSQAPTNLQAMQNAQLQLGALADEIDRARERRLLLERQLDGLESELTEAAAAATPNLAAQQLAAAREQLQALLARATPDHPDVRALQRTIRDLEAKAEAEAAQPPPASKVATARPKAADVQRQQRRRDLTEQIADIDRQLAAKQREDRTLRASIAGYEAKLGAVPKRESELVELTRDYATLQTTYQNLLAKRQDAKIASNLELRNIGPQFKILDPPKVPGRPFSPNRRLIDLGGAVAGFLLGALTVALLEYRKSSFAKEEEVERLLNLRVLAVMPVMVSPSEHRARRRRVVVAGIAAILVSGAVAVLLVGGVRLPF